MEFRTSIHLRKATGRAKSDVANKLVSMLLHEISRRVIEASGGLNITDPAYVDRVEHTFGPWCLYCGRELENDKVAVEHLEGMNRFRLGLHVPGNVAVACIWCNREKRRDDQLTSLNLASSGWESFLSHDGSRCPPGCKTCAYWTRLFPNEAARFEHLVKARRKVHEFRAGYAVQAQESDRVKAALHDSVERLYRECQAFASDRIATLGAEVLSKM